VPLVNVSQTLGGEHVGFVEIDDAEWDFYFGPLRLGRFHERTLLIEDALGRSYRVLDRSVGGTVPGPPQRPEHDRGGEKAGGQNGL
jgi:hypothetical protein